MSDPKKGRPDYTKKTSLRPGTLLAPVPAVLVTCQAGGVRNVLTVAWTGICCTKPPMTYISVRPERFSYPLLRESGEFVIHLPGSELVRQVDLCGVKSGRDTDKFALCGLTVGEASQVSAPLIGECPLALECRVTQVLELGSHHMFLAEIVAVDAAEELLDGEGRLCLERAGLSAYAHGSYYTLGKKIGSFGFSVRKKKVRRGRKERKK